MHAGRPGARLVHLGFHESLRLTLLSVLTATHVARGFHVSASHAASEPGKMDPHAYTALPIAAARALSTERNGGVHDPLARKLVAGEDKLLREGANVGYMTKRALIGDELVLDHHKLGTRQVVSLGAGMDSRAFRLGLHDTVFFEVDKLGLCVLLHHSQLARAQHHDGRSHLGLSQKLCGCDPCTDVLQAPDIKMPEMPTLPDIKLPCPPDVSLPEAPCLPCTVVVSRPAAGENAAISRSHAHVLKFSQARELFNSSLKKFKSLQAPAGLSRERIFMCRENEESEFIVLHTNIDDLRSRMRAATERFAAFGESRWDANGNRIVLQRSRSVHRLKRECCLLVLLQ